VVSEVTVAGPGPSRPRLLAQLLPAVLVIWGFVAVYLLQVAIDAGGRTRQRERAVEEMMYFPSGRFMRQASIEYEMLASDIVWLRAVQYYGYHLMTDRKYEWLGHVFEILTALDPRFIGAYHFGAITLAWDARKPNEALELLVRGMSQNPTNWRLAFDAGFISYLLMKDYDTAVRYFRVAAELPGAWHIARRWAAAAATKAGSYDAARDMWLEIYQSTENRRIKELVVRQLRSLKFNEELARLQDAVDRFREERGAPPDGLEELVRRGYIPAMPEEPYGGRYYIDGDKVRSSTPSRLRE
jgi:tetratricopeptide (TPR) repeat protein